MTDPVVSRLHQCLLDAIRRRGEEPAGRAFRVSEIYQDLVPYREVRSTLGVELNADYEHALLRLLSGEGGLLRLEPEEAREELRREVESAYPFVGMYRKFSINEVWIGAADAAAPVEAGQKEAQAAAPSAEPPANTAPPPAESHPVRQDPPRHAPPERQPPPRWRNPPAETPQPQQEAPPPQQAAPPHRIEERRSPEERVVSTAAECAFCDQALPVGRRVRFCPWCGSDQKLRPCPRCDEVLDRVWRFCINCGLEVPILAAPRPPDPDE